MKYNEKLMLRGLRDVLLEQIEKCHNCLAGHSAGTTQLHSVNLTFERLEIDKEENK